MGRAIPPVDGEIAVGDIARIDFHFRIPFDVHGIGSCIDVYNKGECIG